VLEHKTIYYSQTKYYLDNCEIGIFIAFTFLKLHAPLLYIPMALIIILDGGLGLIKVSFMRFLHEKGALKIYEKQIKEREHRRRRRQAEKLSEQK